MVVGTHGLAAQNAADMRAAVVKRWHRDGKLRRVRGRDSRRVRERIDGWHWHRASRQDEQRSNHGKCH
jgi:hypothetical protein